MKREREKYEEDEVLYASIHVQLTKDELNAILEGKCYTTNDGEYAIFVTLDREVNLD